MTFVNAFSRMKDDAFSVCENENQRSAEVGLKLQEAYMTKVVQELNKITV